MTSEISLKDHLEALLLERDKRLHEQLEFLKLQLDQVNRTLSERIDKGDENLIIHIKQQVGQIEAALVSAHREAILIHDASEQAILKSETATEKRFDSVNEFRAQLQDQANRFAPRELFESQVDEIKRKVDDNTRRINEWSGRDKALTKYEDSSTGWKIALAGFAVTVFITIVVIAVNILTSQGS